MQVSIAWVLLARGAKLSISGAQKFLVETWPMLPQPTKPEKTDSTIAFDVGHQCSVILGLMPAPVPAPDLEGPIATAFFWPNAASEVPTHRTHIIVTVMSESSKIEQNTLLSQVIASILATCEQAMGVYWSDAAMLVNKQVFTNFAQEFLPDRIPIDIWVDFRSGKNQDGTTGGFTYGLRPLGLMEMETLSAPEEPGVLRERFQSLVYYQLENGPVINDGDTIGESADDRAIRVVYAPSQFGNPETVMRLDYGGGKKETWW